MENNEDDDLARAIALSLQEAESAQQNTPELISSDDDDSPHDKRFQRDLQSALELSKAQSKGSIDSQLPTRFTIMVGASQSQGSSSQSQAASSSRLSNSRRSPSNPRTDVTSNHVSATTTSSFLSERAKLERERLERQKRLRPASPPRTASSGQTTESETELDTDEEDRRPKKRRQNAVSSSADVSKQSLSKGKASGKLATVDQMFWEGELRQTATRFADPRKDGEPTFRLTEILGPKSDLQFAILSSYALDWSWIYGFFDRSVPVIMVAQPDESGDATVKHVLPNWVRATPFLRGGRGCQHMKFMLLFYRTGRLRVVISTANLIPYDWRDMENSVWLQDIPLRSKAVPHDPKADDFPASLQRVLYAINVKAALAAHVADNHHDLPIQSIDELRQKWDWSNVKVHLVASIAGKHEGWPAVVKTGHPRLMMAVRRMGMRTGKDAKSKILAIECQGSSVGLYSKPWLHEFHYSARGESAEDWLDISKRAREKLPLPSIKIVFPTKETVGQSALGEKGGGTIFCRRRQWSSKNFPTNIFYDSKSKAGPVLMHSKMIISMLQDNPIRRSLTASSSNLKGKRKQDEDRDSDDDIEVVEPAAGWVYVGSHNFTPSAWGTLSGSSFNPVLNVTNYELGIVHLLKDAKDADRVGCFERPPKKYTTKDEAWIQEDSVYFQAQAQEAEDAA